MMTMINARSRLACLFPLMALVIACGGEGDAAVGSQSTLASPAANESPTTGDLAGAAEPTLTIEGRAFGQVPEVGPGDSFAIVNLDSTPHTFTSADGSWESVQLEGDSEAAFTVPETLAPGEHPFLCAIHPDMTGTLQVSG